MSETVTVTVQRLHTNDLGTHSEGETYETTPQHAMLLADRNLVTISGTKADPKPDNKSDAPPDNKGGTGTKPTPAALLEMAADDSVKFPAFKAAATELLGNKTPAKKAAIIAALEALA